MDVNDLTIGQARELTELFGVGNKTTLSPWVLGKNYLIRTVTMTLTGKLTFIGENELSLDDAAWIADTGRFSECLKTCNFSEVEIFKNSVIVGRGSVIDATEIKTLPRDTK